MFCLMVSCFICRSLTLPSLEKGVFVRNGYFSPMILLSVVIKQAFFYFNFNLIESYVYSIFGSSVIILVYDTIFPK